MEKNKRKRNTFAYNRYKQQQHKKRRQQVLETGLKGFFCTCNGKEKECIKESYNILNYYADQLIGPEEGITDENGKESNEDIEDEINKEIDSLKMKSSPGQRRFQAVDTGANSCVFIKTTVEDPIQLVRSVYEDVEKTKQQKGRYLLRLVPIEVTCKAYIEDIRKTADQLFDKHFRCDPSTFCIFFKCKVSKLRFFIMNSDTGDRTWGHLEDTELFGRISDSADYIQLLTDALKDPQYHDCTQACHCMIFARNTERIFNVYSARASVLMQMRFDGYLGFPGGLVDPDEDHVLALNRELHEEMNLDLNKHSVKQENHVVSHFSKSKKLCLHFYALEVTLKELHEIEKNCIIAKDYGHEVLGTVRVPLYTMGDGFRGFPTFLTNAFIGNARLQLLYALKHFNILTSEEIRMAEQATPVSSIAK